MKDLIVLTADLDTENVLQGLLPRLPRVVGIREIAFDIRRHPYRDPGCATGSVDFLRPFIQQYSCALVVFDKEGSGKENKSREDTEAAIEENLATSGWDIEKVAVVAIDPEVENWIWINSPRVVEALGWYDEIPLYDWLKSNEWLMGDMDKPRRPKEAMEAVLRKTRKARSASIYRQIATGASFKNCTDPAFHKLLDALKKWFPQE